MTDIAFEREALALFEDIFALPPEERAVALARLTAGRETLRARVEAALMPGLVLPAFEKLLVPANFHGHFSAYMVQLLP